MLRQKFAKAYVLAKDVAIDEAMISFKGRTAFLQYTPLKPTKRGIRGWTMAGELGYVYSFDVYAERVKR